MIEICKYEAILSYKHITFTAVVSYIIPIVIMTPMYGYMVKTARKHVRSGIIHVFVPHNCFHDWRFNIFYLEISF